MKDTGTKKYTKYVCLGYKRKGTIACAKPFYISKDWIDEKVIEERSRRYITIGP